MGIGSSAAADQPTVAYGAEVVGRAVTPVVINVDQSALPAPKLWRPGDPVREIPLQISKNFNPPAREPRPIGLDPLLALDVVPTRGDPGIGTPLISFSGAGFSGISPADTSGDVGHEHFIQMINHSDGSLVRIYNKISGLVEQFFTLESLAMGSGTTCVNGRGDPIVIFDETADNGPEQPKGRWLLTEFTPMGINTLCIYVSQTSDPTEGGWFLYEIESISGAFPDYPKYAVWPDAYYLGVNERIDINSGPHQYALDRENMLLGLTARAPQAFTTPKLPGFNFQHVIPVDWDGDMPPPPGSPGLFLRHRDTEIHGPPAIPDTDIIELFEFSVDFDNPGNSTFTGPFNIYVSEFDSEFCDLIFSGCLRQPGTSTRLFALLQPIMWRAQYRNFGSHQSIVANMVTDVTGNDLAGIRWFELRSLGSHFDIFQEGTIAKHGPVDGSDGINRWMASVAQDQSGNVVAGYNAVGLGTVSPADDVFPSIRYSARSIIDPPGTMAQGEFSIIDGGSPSNTIRYGDYSSLSLDPNDECTFWYTAQHNPHANNNWDTQIAAFRFNDCGEPGFVLAAEQLNQQICAPGNALPININVGSVFDFNNPVTLSLDSAPSGITANFSPNPVMPSESSTAVVSVSGSAPLGAQQISILGTAIAADDRTLAGQIDIFDAIPGIAQLNSPINGQSLVPVQPLLTWTEGSQSAEFIIEIDDDPDFGSIDYTVTTTDSTHTVLIPLVHNQLYFWRIRSSNACDVVVSETFSFTTAPPPGECQPFAETHILFSDDIESGDNGWTHDGLLDTWQRSSQEVSSGDFAWFAEDLPEVSDQRLVSPPVYLPVGELPMVLTYQNSQTIEDDSVNDACWDAGILEMSIDDGNNWAQISPAQLATDPYDGTVNLAVVDPNPLSGLSGWCGDPQSFALSVVDLAAYQGETVRFRFRLGTDGTIGRFDDGWFIDDVQVQSCEIIEDILFDGFENSAD